MAWLRRRDGAMEAGERDRIVTVLQRPVADSVDSENTPIDGPWTTLITNMPAAKVDLSGIEALNGGQVTAKFDTRWEMNYRVDMDPDLLDVPKLRRLVYQGRTLEIIHARQIGRREGVELLTIASAGAE